MTRILPLLAAPLFASMSASCILTEPPRFEPPPNQPPSIDTRATPMWKIFRLTEDQVGSENDAGPTNALDFSVVVIDQNVEQALDYRVYVDFRGSETSRLQGPIPRVVSGDRTRRTLEFTLPATTFREPRCHWVELLVSSDFRSDTREPVEDNDIATASWFVLTTATGEQSVDVDSCTSQGAM